ncbi:MAG TPA: BTAD domain-containing putative transcriptional regulator [Streptosporangiaceae bacterium]|nr:BTAD domain-containing putative transcriptional regulator [Streptosporangiaceae bacterium]
MIYRLLGELEIGEGSRLLDLPGGPTLIVLAALLVNANRRMSKTELIRAAWGNDDVEEAQLYKRVKVVRDLLAGIGLGGHLKTHPRFGYEMRVAEADVDALLFQRLVLEADEAGAEHRTEDEIGHLRHALRLWRGPHPLSNVPSDAFRQEIVALEQRHKRAAVRLFDLELARDHHERVLGELMLMAGHYPADRRLCEQLMLAEYRCGHLADVASAYERYRETLEEETGGEPDALLRNLHFAVARGDHEAIAAAESALADRTRTPARPAAVPRQLPPATDLVGRADLAAEVSWLLRRESRSAVPVVVISGPGGIGKTALALRAAHESSDRYPDGQLYLELRRSTGGAVDARIDTGEVLAQFLRALGVPRVPEAVAERLATYRTWLADRRVLIVLDDAPDGTQVGDLVPANAGCAVLVTARQRLPEVAGAHHVAPLEPLERAEATELFLRVVADAGINLENDRAAVDRVVTLCGGLPLALRIAGALRVHNHPQPTAELAGRLARQGPAAFAYGELNVARTIGAGFERLDDGARQLFLALGLLPLNGFGLWTAAALLGGADASVPLSQLAASFMIESVEPEMRYRFHDLTREYARRRALGEYAGDQGAIPRQVYRALLTLARRAHARLYGGDFEVVHSDVTAWDAPPEALAEVDADPLDWFEKERSNIRAAVEHCAALGLTGICWDLAVSSHEFYTLREYFDDWYATHAVALDACLRAGDRRGEGVVLTCRNQPALVASRRAGDAGGVAELERAVGLLADCGDQHGQAIALRTLANALRRQGHLTRPLALFHDALARYTASGDTVGRWLTLRFIGHTHLDRGDHEAALRMLEQARTVADGLGGGRLIAQTRYWIGQVCLAMGDTDGAQAAFDVVFDVYGQAGGVGRAYAVHGMGEVAWRRGAYAAAESYFAEALSLVSDGTDAILEGRVWLSSAALCRAQGQAGEQVTALRQATAAFAGCGAAYLEIRALAGLARVMAEQGDEAAAQEARHRVEELYELAGVPEGDRIGRNPRR